MAQPSTASPNPPLTETLARRAVEEAAADKRAELVEGMQRIVEATYELVERSGTVDPSLRQILSHTGLSTQAFYRHFRSKDELILALLDDGRRRLVTHVARRMQRAQSPDAQVRAWIEGVMAQASDARAAARTRPFVAEESRLAEMFPEEHDASVEQLESLLVVPLAALSPNAGGRGGDSRARRDARAVYLLTFATLHEHLMSRRVPAPATVSHLVAFVLRGIGGPG